MQEFIDIYNFKMRTLDASAPLASLAARGSSKRAEQRGATQPTRCPIRGFVVVFVVVFVIVFVAVFDVVVKSAFVVFVFWFVIL